MKETDKLDREIRKLKREIAWLEKENAALKHRAKVLTLENRVLDGDLKKMCDRFDDLRNSF